MSFRKYGWPIPSSDIDAKRLVAIRDAAKEAEAAGEIVERNKLLKRHDDLVMKRWREKIEEGW